MIAAAVNVYNRFTPPVFILNRSLVGAPIVSANGAETITA
jgi:hypothetical protein